MYGFLSHARADAADPYFEKFVGDFIGELRALCTCRSFIAMLSPTYVLRPACSKEWAAFDWRLRGQMGASPPNRGLEEGSASLITSPATA